MMYFDEFSKYKTGKRVNRPARIVNTDPPQNIEIKVDEYSIPLGDLIAGFLAHREKPWWKRKWDHKFVENQYIKILNSAMVIITGF